MDITPRRPAGTLCSVTSPGVSPIERARRPTARLHPRKEWWKEKPYKRRRSTPKRGLEFHIFKVTIREQQACNLVNVNVSIYMLIVKCNLSFFHKTLSSWIRFFSDIPVRFGLFRFGDPINNNTTKYDSKTINQHAQTTNCTSHFCNLHFKSSPGFYPKLCPFYTTKFNDWITSFSWYLNINAPPLVCICCGRPRMWL